MQDIFQYTAPSKEPYHILERQQGGRSGDLERSKQMDMEYFKSLYPSRVKRLQVHVEEACDRMEYKDSPMYDEYPDRVMINQVTDAILEMIRQEMEAQADQPVVKEVEQVEVYQLGAQSRDHRPPGPPWGPPPGPPPWGPPPGPPHWGPPPGPPHWGPPPGPPQWGPPPRPPYPPTCGRNDWLCEITRIMLLNEMQHRRCRGRYCR